MNVAVVVYDGFDDMDAVGPYEVFGHARTFGADLDVGIYTRTPRTVVTSSHGLRIEPDAALEGDSRKGSSREDARPDAGASAPDIVIVPGGGWAGRAAEGAWAEAEQGDLLESLRRCHGSGATLAAVCTGGMLLARAGLTDGRSAVTHHAALEDLRDSGAEVVEARVVDDGDVVTAGGVTSGIDLALHLVGREFGEALAERVAAEMEYEPRGEVYVS